MKRVLPLSARSGTRGAHAAYELNLRATEVRRSCSRTDKSWWEDISRTVTDGGNRMDWAAIDFCRVRLGHAMVANILPCGSQKLLDIA